jgi:hypothetical protein
MSSMPLPPLNANLQVPEVTPERVTRLAGCHDDRNALSILILVGAPMTGAGTAGISRIESDSPRRARLRSG